MRRITLAEASEAVDKAVADRGEDYVYPAAHCTYRWTPVHVVDRVVTEQMVGEPSCLVGAALAYLGVLDWLVPRGYEDDADGAWWENNDDTNITSLIELTTADVVFDEAAAEFLEHAQNAQDTKQCWGLARRIARSNVGLPLDQVSPSNPAEVEYATTAKAPAAR